MTTGGRGRSRAGGGAQEPPQTQQQTPQQAEGGTPESRELRDFKTRARAMPADQREEAFQSDEFRRLIAAAAVPAVVAEAECASHCFSHCGSHCYGHG